jgi:hypoxanthine phosphoribosyltransferase
MPSDYLCFVLNIKARKLIIKRLIEEIYKSSLEFDSIVFRGMSGAVIAPSIADKLNKDLILCRKSEERHSFHDIEYVGSNIGSYIIIDDLICSGKTILAITEMIDAEWHTKETVRKRNYPNEKEIPRPKCVGIFLYHDEIQPKNFDFKDYCRRNDDFLKVSDSVKDYYRYIPIYAFYDGEFS